MREGRNGGEKERGAREGNVGTVQKVKKKKILGCQKCKQRVSSVGSIKIYLKGCPVKRCLDREPGRGRLATGHGSTRKSRVY